MTKICRILKFNKTVRSVVAVLFLVLHNERDMQKTMSLKKAQRLRSLANLLMTFLPRSPLFEFLLNRRENIDPIAHKSQVSVVLWMMHNEMVTELQQFYEMHKHIKGNALECVLVFLQASHEKIPEHTIQGLWEIPGTSICSLSPSLACVRRVNEKVIMHLKFVPVSECWRFQTLIAEQLSELPLRKQINKAYVMLEIFGEHCVIDDLIHLY